MNNYSNMNNEVVDQSSAEGYASKKSYKHKIMIGILSLVLSFAIWCLAEYQSDPIIKTNIVVEFNLINAQPGERLSKTHDVVTIYCKESASKNLSILPFQIDANDFRQYNEDGTLITQYNTNKKITGLDDEDNTYHTHDDIYIKLIKNDTSSGK